ncbi:putative DNA-binding domain-containing protein [Alloacidobacterium dinghuense]|uniref:Putative DNA-binding domain-containing protein n=1 Tax=Alloacidobacterium dinghuense TaxID=2763107 RepID=A0A7G8BMW9_9BACT|nr:putative DNA-binding domain-containing protein [Alloacidobacterium dinghuense]QNI33889.1 putative DNA-binding domain-containing protein [Alloacidobacterium dinghuense]
MSELLEIQRRVAAAIMHPLTQQETMLRKRNDGTSNKSEADAIIKPNDRLSSFERLEIYNRQYWFRLYSSFEEDFPGLMAVIGRKKFDVLTRAYLTDFPSQSFSLRNLGSQLEHWLLSHREYIEPRAELALDMVRIEWAHIEAFDSASDALIDADDLAGIHDGSQLHLQPYLRVLQLQYPVDDLIIELRSESGSSDSSSNNASIARKRRKARHVAALEPEEIYLALHRHENSVYYKRLSREDYRLLSALMAGEPIGKAIDTAFEGSEIPEEERASFLQVAFQTWSSLGWFTR